MAEIEKILDGDMYKEYIKKAAPVVTRYGGEYVLKSDRLNLVSGDWNVKRIILIRFANKQQIRDCFQSSDYLEIAHLRINSTESKAIIIEDETDGDAIDSDQVLTETQ